VTKPLWNYCIIQRKRSFSSNDAAQEGTNEVANPTAMSVIESYPGWAKSQR
jgi:hypothetical protein